METDNGKHLNTVDDDIKLFRALRIRSEDLMRTITEDLRPFLHSHDNVTFIRKPGSPADANDVNVTTTCSCLMALALTKRAQDLYASNEGIEEGQKRTKQSLLKAFRLMLGAPWMSSGLTENNFFTTTLVLRACAYLSQSGELSTDDIKGLKKTWDLRLGIANPNSFAKKIMSGRSRVLRFLHRSLSHRTRTKINKCLKSVPAKPLDDEAIESLNVDLDKIIHGSWIYEPERFPRARLSTKTFTALRKNQTDYSVPLLNHQLLREMLPDQIKTPSDRTLESIARELGSDPRNFSINQYPASSAVVYWFIDAVDRLGFDFQGSHWQALCKWASEEFYHQQSLVVSESEAMMDPVAMAMAACTCRRLKKIASQPKSSGIKGSFSPLPSELELRDSILKLLPKQTKTGIWPKYFPMFHYREGGSNFCFTLEMLEAVLVEFSAGEDSLMQDGRFVKALNKALDWCNDNRKEFKDGNKLYCGWPSGHDADTLKKGQPESWATAVAHMFLWELQRALSTAINRAVLDKYRARVPESKPTWHDLLDMDAQFCSHRCSTVKSVLEREIMGSMLLVPEDIKDLGALRRKIKYARGGSLSAHIKKCLSSRTLNLLGNRGKAADSKLRLALTNDLNSIIAGKSLYTKDRFRYKELSSDSKALLVESSMDQKTPHLNRLLLRDAYKEALSSEQLSSRARGYRRFAHTRIKGRRSVLLFGPPGTSKTTIVRAFAAELRWPLVEIEPSNFLTSGMENIYGRAKEIFEDLGDLSAAVVFFDEMDALVRTRDDEAHPLDVMSRFLTTSMLPKLAKLHDDGRVIFFFATNYQGEFDQAIKRPGRFDILLCVWPPTWVKKLESINKLVEGKVKDSDLERLKKELNRLVAQTKSEERQILDLLTFNEARNMLERLANDGDLLTQLVTLSGEDFSKCLKDFEKTITLRRDKPSYQRYNNERGISQLQ